VQELLFALARDAKINVDVHSDIKGMVTLNAIEQTLPQLLARIAKQVEMRYELDGQTLLVQPDSPYLKTYKVDYVNMTRDSSNTVKIATQIATTGSSPVGGGSASSSGDNNSATNITSTSNNRFWPTLVANIQDILRETDKVIPETGSTNPPQTVPQSISTASKADPPAAPKVTYREAASVIANPENGVISVRATSRQHESIQEFLTSVMISAKRQVLIEATVIEVQLSDQYQQGIDWQILSNSADGFNLVHLPQGSSALSTGATPGGSYTSPILANGNPIFGSGNPAAMLINYTNPDLWGYNVAATISLLESFGNVKVLSSPKISVLNNQTALLKVVDNKVYFTIDVTTTQSQDLVNTVYTSIVHTVPIGFVMGVTPQIDETHTVTLNVRPTISRITGYVNDPNPALAQANVTSQIPEIQTREMESILKIHDGQVAIMGGLMQDTLTKKTDGVPVLSQLPVIGNAFNYKNDSSSKSELVIFLRPSVVKYSGSSGEREKLQSLLPDKTFFDDQPGQNTVDSIKLNPFGAIN
jgi:MSHA biogenesis protein MshL